MLNRWISLNYKKAKIGPKNINKVFREKIKYEYRNGKSDSGLCIVGGDGGDVLHHI